MPVFRLTYSRHNPHVVPFNPYDALVSHHATELVTQDGWNAEQTAQWFESKRPGVTVRSCTPCCFASQSAP